MTSLPSIKSNGFFGLGRLAAVLGWIVMGIAALIIGDDWVSPLTDAQLTHVTDNYGPAALLLIVSFWFSTLGALIWLLSAVAMKRLMACMMCLGCCGLAFAAVWRESLLADRVEAVTPIRVSSLLESWGWMQQIKVSSPLVPSLP